MPVRITGLNSNMDTEAIIQEMVKAKKTKVDDLKKAQTKLEWKQEAWKGLNSKIYNLFNKTLNDLRFDDAYQKKTTRSSSSAVSVVASANAVNGVQEVRVTALAKSATMTSGKLSPVSDGNGGTTAVSGSTKLTDMGVNVGEKISLTKNGVTTDIEITQDMTVEQLNGALRATGITASFDANNQRFFLNAKSTGAAENFTITGDANALNALGFAEKPAGAADDDKYATKVNGTDAEIYLNGARFTSDSNVFNINGLDIAVSEVTGNQIVSLTTEDDYDGIYDVIKNFISEYSSLINEMDSLYNADSARGYDPLTDDEKSEMSDKDVEKWEQKVKDSILRKDSTLSTVSNALYQIMGSGYEVNGKTMYLSDFGVETLGYFSSSDNEKHAYHITGDTDDEKAPTGDNKLKSALANDPDTVINFFTGLTNSMYTKLQDLMGSTDYSSIYKVYDDKKMKEDYNAYTTKIKEAETKLKSYEDKWYAKFAAMETALAKMQSKSSAISGLLGGA